MIRFGWLVSSVALTLVTAFLNQANATLLVYEPFNYEAGRFLANTSVGATSNNTNSPIGYLAPNNNNWFGTGVSGGYAIANDGQITATDLSVVGLDKPSTTGSLTLGGAGHTMRLSLNTSIGPPNQTGPNLTDTSDPPFSGYYSFVLRVDSLGTLQAAGGIIAGFNTVIGAQTGNPATVGAGLAIRPKAGGNPGEFELGIGKSQASSFMDAGWSPNTYTVGQTIFVVGKYETVAGALNDVVTLWVNPAYSTFGGDQPAGGVSHATISNNDLPNNAGTNNHTLQSFMFRQSGATDNAQIPGVVVFDELRVGQTWADVTPRAIPEPGSLALLGAAFGVLFVRRGGRSA